MLQIFCFNQEGPLGGVKKVYTVLTSTVTISDTDSNQASSRNSSGKSGSQ